MRLSGKELRRLHDLVLEAVESEAELERLADDANLRLKEIAKPGNLNDMVSELLRWLEARERTGEFINALRNARSNLAKDLLELHEIARSSGKVTDYIDPHGEEYGGAVKSNFIFAFEEIISLHRALVMAGFNDETKIALLFAGLPRDYVALLPSEGNPAEKLLARLHAVNGSGGKIDGHSVFYYLLRTAEQLRRWDDAWTKLIEAYLTKVAERDK